jgi:hypothetical protein
VLAVGGVASITVSNRIVYLLTPPPFGTLQPTVPSRILLMIILIPIRSCDRDRATLNLKKGPPMGVSKRRVRPPRHVSMVPCVQPTIPLRR